MHNVTSTCARNCATDSPQKVISFHPQGSHFFLAQFQHTLQKVITTLCTCCHISLTLILLTWRIWWAPNNASKWQMGFNSVFKGLKNLLYVNTEFGLVNLSIKHNVKISACQNVL